MRVLGRYTYLLSNGQKWNSRLLKCYEQPVATWTELMGVSLTNRLRTLTLCMDHTDTQSEKGDPRPIFT